MTLTARNDVGYRVANIKRESPWLAINDLRCSDWRGIPRHAWTSHTPSAARAVCSVVGWNCVISAVPRGPPLSPGLCDLIKAHSDPRRIKSRSDALNR